MRAAPVESDPGEPDRANDFVRSTPHPTRRRAAHGCPERRLCEQARGTSGEEVGVRVAAPPSRCPLGLPSPDTLTELSAGDDERTESDGIRKGRDLRGGEVSSGEVAVDDGTSELRLDRPGDAARVCTAAV
jgi:hypothetical protein